MILLGRPEFLGILHFFEPFRPEIFNVFFQSAVFSMLETALGLQQTAGTDDRLGVDASLYYTSF